MWFRRSGQGSVEGRLRALEDRLAKVEAGHSDIGEIQIDWARTKQSLKRLAGLISKSTAIDFPPTPQQETRGAEHAAHEQHVVDLNTLDRETIASLPYRGGDF